MRGVGRPVEEEGLALRSVVDEVDRLLADDVRLIVTAGNFPIPPAPTPRDRRTRAQVRAFHVSQPGGTQWRVVL